MMYIYIAIGLLLTFLGYCLYHRKVRRAQQAKIAAQRILGVAADLKMPPVYNPRHRNIRYVQKYRPKQTKQR